MFFDLRSWIDSMVYFSSPCIKSTTKMAKSHNEDPLDHKLLKDSCPGVSITNNPGTLISPIPKSFFPSFLMLLTSASYGKYVAPIYWVIPPASPACTFVDLILSKSKVLPVSTCPNTQMIGHLKLSVMITSVSFAAFDLWAVNLSLSKIERF